METAIELINSKHYGAEELQKTYSKSLRKSFIAAILFHAVLFTVYLIFSYYNSLNADIPKDKVLIIRQYNIEDLKNTYIPPEDIKEPLTDVTTVKITPVKDLKALDVIPVGTKDAEISTIKTQTELDNIRNIVSKTGDSTGNNDGIASNVIVIPDNTIKDGTTDNITTNGNGTDNTDKPNGVFFDYQVEKAPGCINLNQIKSSIGYPDMAREAGIEGMVTIKVLVNEQGDVINTGRLTGPEAFHDAVKDKANDLKFTPGLQNNRPVKCWVTVPFKFKLQ